MRVATPAGLTKIMAERKKNKNWIQGAIKHPGALTRKANKAGETPMEFADEHADDPGTTGKQARLAKTLAGFRRK